MSGSAAVHIHSLWKRFGYRRALVDVGLKIGAGTCFAIFGPNGAGKSTLLKILATRARPSSGRVEVHGFDLRRQPDEVRRSIGVVFHESCLRSDLTLDENLRFYSGLYGLPRRSERVGELLELLDLADRQRDPVRTFSQGMMKRAAIIRSLLHDPVLWLLDEPFSGLDPAGRELLAGLVRRERDAGRTIALVTHDLERGLALADDAIVLRAGEVVARGKEPARAEMRRNGA